MQLKKRAQQYRNQINEIDFSRKNTKFLGYNKI